MKNILRYGLYTLGGLILLLVLALAYIFFMFDPNSLRPRIEQLVTSKTERRLKLEGDIRLRLWPSVGATVDKASWSEYRSEQVFVELGHIQVDLAFWPLLQQRYVVQELEVDGLKGRIARHADGSLSIADLIKPKAKATEDGGAPVEFAVDRIRIRNAAFTFDDRQNQRVSSIEQLSLSADQISKAGLENLDVAARIRNSAPLVDIKLALKAGGLQMPEGKPMVIKGPQLEASGTLPEGIVVKRLALTSTQLSLVPQGPLAADDLDLQADAQSPQGKVDKLVLQLKRLDADSAAQTAGLQGLKLSGQASAPQGNLKALDLQLAKAALQLKGDSSVEGLVLHAEGDTPDLKAIKLDLKAGASGNADTRSASIRQLDLKASAQRQQQALALALSAPAAQYAGGKLSAEQMQAHATLKSPTQAADVQLQLSGVNADPAASVQVRQLKAQGSAKQNQDAIRFNLDTPLRTMLQPLQIELPALKLDASVNTPKLKSGAATLKVNGSSSANIAAEQIDARLAGQFDASRGHVHATVKGFKQPAVDFDVALDQLSLDRYLAAAPAPAAKPAQTTDASTPLRFDLSPLAPLQLDGKLAVQRILKDKLEIKNLAVKVKAGKGLMSIPELSVQAFEGTLNGSLSATTTANPTFKVKQTLSGIDINQVLTTFADFNKLRGRGTVVADLTATGATLDLLKKSAQGSVNAKLSNGAWKGINIGKTLREGRAMLQGGLQTRQSVSDEETDFSEMSATVKLANGIASNDDLAAKSPLFRIGGKGQANLVDNTLDYLVQASIVGSSQGQGGRELEQLKGLTIPIRIKGTFDKPSYALDYNAMLKDSTKAKLEEQKQALEAKAKQEVDTAKEQAQKKLEEQKQKASEKLQNELKKGLGNLFGK